MRDQSVSLMKSDTDLMLKICSSPSSLFKFLCLPANMSPANFPSVFVHIPTIFPPWAENGYTRVCNKTECSCVYISLSMSAWERQRDCRVQAANKILPRCLMWRHKPLRLQWAILSGRTQPIIILCMFISVSLCVCACEGEEERCW